VPEARVEPSATWPQKDRLAARAEQSSPQGCDRVDLDELVGVPEHRDAEQGARRVVRSESVADDLPGSDEVASSTGGDVDCRPHNIVEAGAGVGQGLLKVDHHLSRLGPDVS